MPRRLRFPDLPKGPHLELLLFLHGLHQLAGEPSTRDIADGIFKTSNGEIRCSHTTIHALLSGRKLPTNGDLLFELVKFLNNRNRHRRADEDSLLDELDQLWRPATRRHLLDLPAAPPPRAGTSGLDNGVSSSTVFSADSAIEGSFTPTELVGDKRTHTNAASDGGTDYTAQDRTHTGSAADSHFFRDDRGPLRSPALPDLRTSWAVLAGVSQYRDMSLPELPSVLAGTQELRRLLSGPGGAFDEHNVISTVNPSTRDLFESVHGASEQAEDVLLIYFAGHGLISRKGDLLLATPDTVPSQDFTTAPYATIRDLMAASRARRSVVILDSCFSGRALETMGPLDGLTAIPTTYVITSTSSNRASFAPAYSRYTSFTGALIETLSSGIPGGGELLTIDDIYQQLYERASEQGFPLPQKRVGNDHGLGIALARNPAFVPGDRN